MRLLIDGHLDLAMNALDGRDLSLPLDELRRADPVPDQTAALTLPELRDAGVRVCLGTLFALPAGPGRVGYTDVEGARGQALAQLAVYERWQSGGYIQILRSGVEVAAHLAAPDGPLGVVLLMEGADPIRDAADLPFWVERGVRVIGPAWERTRFAGGTGQPGPLTAAGRELVRAMRELNLTLDASHLDDAAFWEAAELGVKLVATHANSRAFVDGNRHLTDEMARAVASTGGMLGLVFHSRFIRRGWQTGQPGAPLAELLRHAEHYAELVGWERVGLGTDLDGGFGVEKAPSGIGRYADLPEFLKLVPPEHRAGVAGGHWARWLTGLL